MKYQSKHFLLKFAVIVMVITAVSTAFVCTLFFGALNFAVSSPAAMKFSKIEELIKMQYLNGYDEDKVFEKAFYGMVDALDDPYSVYLNAQDMEELNDSLKGDFLGIGVEITVDPADNMITVIAPIADGSAERNGVLAGDKFIRVNGMDAGGERMEFVVGLLRNGPAGEKIELTLLRDGEEVEITAERETIHTKTVKWQMLGGDVGYIRISSFNKNSYDEFSEALAGAENAGAVGIVLDLRNNPGGTVDETVKIAKRFLGEEQVIYFSVDKKGKKDYIHSGENADSIPITVLVNGGSASASEILAGALKDNNRAILIGTKTYGKGIVQRYFELDSATGLKLTTAEWMTPHGNAIHGSGIEPDVVVEQDISVRPGDPEDDIQLKTAVEYLR